MINFCDSLKTQPFVNNKDVNCWSDSFYKRNLNGTDKIQPYENSFEFNEKLWEWATTTKEGQVYYDSNTIGFINKRLKYFKIETTTEGS